MSSGTARHGRTTVGDAAEQQGWTPSSARTTAPSRDGRAMSVLRAVTYVLVSLVCLLLLAAAAYGAVLLDRVGTGPSGSSDPLSVTGGGTGSGEEQFRYACEQGSVPVEQCGG